jgi:uncharacterized iron-regulated membrane protein
MKIKTTLHIHCVKYSWEEEAEYQVYSCALPDSEHRVYVGEQEMEIEVPDDFDPRAKQIAALQRERGKAMADYQKTVDDINERISKLQAITYTGETA